MKVPVLFPKIFDYPFTYKSKGTVSLNSGDFVKVPFGNEEITGVVWPHEQKTKKNFKLKDTLNDYSAIGHLLVGISITVHALIRGEGCGEIRITRLKIV